MATLLLIRHGQASYGQLDYDRLSERGTAQARVLGEHLAAAKLDALYHGPLVRQRQTAAVAAEHGKLPAAVELAELAEYPGFDMVTRFLPKLVAEDPAFAALPSGLGHARPSASLPAHELADRAFKTILGRWSRDEWQIEGVERVTEFVARVRTGLERVIRAAGSGARVGVVTSAGPIGAAVGMVFGASDHHMVRTSLVIRNASISELVLRTRDFAWHPEKISLLTFNSVAHLPADLHTEY
jgi:broad specificity phosphatase PhoE